MPAGEYKYGVRRDTLAVDDPLYLLPHTRSILVFRKGPKDAFRV